MSRTYYVVFFTYIITRLFYGLSGFDPYREIDSILKYPVDLGIWLLVAIPVNWFLRVLRVGRDPNEKRNSDAMIVTRY